MEFYRRYFSELENLLRAEFEADKKEFEALQKNASLHEKKTQGLVWYPLVIKGTETIRGDYLLIHVSSPNDNSEKGNFKVAAPVLFFSQHDYQQYRIEGTVHYVSASEMGIRVASDDLPEWTKAGKLGVELLFDAVSYKVAFDVLSSLKKTEKPNRLWDVLLGVEKPTFRHNFNAAAVPQNLNEYQYQAVKKILEAEEVAIIHGPPGTGKTTTLVAAVHALLAAQPDLRILISAASNTAVDVLAKRLDEAGINVVRIGQSNKISDSVEHRTLEYLLENHVRAKDLRKLRKQAQEYLKMAHTYKRSFGKIEREQRKLLFDEAHQIYKEIDALEVYCIHQIFSDATVVAATLVGVAHHTIAHLKFDVVIIDEAAQALAPYCWIAIAKGKKLILAGDHCQLPPTIKSEGAVADALQDTLFEKLVRLHPEAVVLLQEQYRMHQCIGAFSSHYFYENKLIPHPSVANRTLKNDAEPAVFIDTAGCGFSEEIQGTGIFNPEEALFVANFLQSQYSEWTQNAPSEGEMLEIGVVSPYRLQVQKLKALLEDMILEAQNFHLQLETIDAFQGQEKDIIIVSLVRSNREGTIGFLHDYRRMNVAMTRARKKLILVGDSATLGQIPFYESLIQHFTQLGGYKSAWEFMV